MQILHMAQCGIAHCRGARFQISSGVGDVETVEMDVLGLHQVGDREAEIAVDQQNARLALVFVQVADDRNQSIQFRGVPPASLSRMSSRLRLYSCSRMPIPQRSSLMRVSAVPSTLSSVRTTS